MQFKNKYINKVLTRIKKLKMDLKIRIKEKLINYFLIEKSLDHLMNSSKEFNVISISFDEINDEMKNPKRFKMCILYCVLIWIVTLYYLALVISDHFFSIINGPFLPIHYRTLLSLVVINLIWVSVIKTDFMFGEINCNLSPLKIFYFLINDLESEHKLTKINYKLLTIWSRLIQLCLLDLGIPTTIISAIFINSYFAISSQKLIWIFEAIFISPIYITIGFTAATWMCIVYIIFPYYKFRFDQIHHEIQLLLPNGKVVSRTKEILFTQFIHEHNRLSIEIFKMNSIMRRTAAVMFITFSIVNILSLYLMINMKSMIMKITVTNIFILCFIFGLGLCYLLTLQIKSAHQSYKLLHSIICKYKMRLRFKLKVINSIKFINTTNLHSTF